MLPGKAALLVFLALLLVSRAQGQSPNGTISGVVLDPSGAAIAGAAILVVSDATGAQYETKTNGEGMYLVANLPPGVYRLQVADVGFKTLIKPDIVVHVQDALSINFTLPVGAASEIVTVQAGAPQTNTENAAVSTVIDREFVSNLPLNGRSFNTLLELTPGVVIAQSTAGTPGQFSVAGQRTDANNFTVDGVSANFGVAIGQNLGQSGTGSSQAFSALGGTSSLVSVDALEEFRVETSSFAPEFGRSPGGEVILTTRSGTNDFHGGAFDYFRNTVMDANNWFAEQAGLPRAAEHHNDFGGFLGGRLWKDKTFFFASYEGARLDEPQSEVIQVPSDLARSSAPAALAPFVDAYPEPNGQPSSPGAFVAPFTGNFSNRATLDAGSIRFDHIVNDRLSLFARYSNAPSATLDPTNNLSNLQSITVNTETATLGANMLLGSRATNAFRANYSTQSNSISESLDSFGGAVPISPSLLLGSSLPAPPNAAVFFVVDSSSYFVGAFGRNSTRQWNFTDDLTFATGAHELKFGADYRAIFLHVDATPHEAEYISFSTEAFVNGTAPLAETATFERTEFLTQSLSLYGQDRWRITPRLSFTYGLRWELSPAPAARGRTILASWLNTANPAAVALAPVGTPLWSTSYTNFAPRAGIAYRLNQKGDFVLRAGAGIFYDLGVGSAAGLSLSFPNLAAQIVPGLTLPATDITPFLPAVSLTPPFGTATGFSDHLSLPRSYQWNVALEKSFGGKQVLSATYLGQAGRNLLRDELLEQPNSNFLSTFRLTLNNARSNYNALELQYRRVLSSGLQALLNYSWSHSLDNASNDVSLALSNSVVSALNDYASSDFDVRQSFSGALSYDIPAAAKSGPLALVTKNWSLAAVVVARTGFPFNALVPTPSALGGVGNTRPDLVPGQALVVRGPACAALFQSLGVLGQGESCPGGFGLNPNAFARPSTPRQGTEGRNDISGFGLTQTDLSVARKFPLGERLNLQFRADAFNVLNHPNFTNPFPSITSGPAALLAVVLLNQGLGGLNPLFQEGGPRSLQLGLRLTF
jgi:hypothetical protein